LGKVRDKYRVYPFDSSGIWEELVFKGSKAKFRSLQQFTKWQRKHAKMRQYETQVDLLRKLRKRYNNVE
jgi:hypothetical protein